MLKQMQFGNITADLVLKDIKNVHLSVLPPIGKVRISAPSHMSLDTIRVFTISKLSWIKKQQRKFQEQERETPREYIDRESHSVWGKRYLLKIIESKIGPRVELRRNQICVRANRKLDKEERQKIVESWYREQLKQNAAELIAKWEKVIDVKVSRLFIQKMKTKWGGCNVSAKNIRLNLELTKKPVECLEYVVVHELMHLIEKTHNHKFVAMMDNFLPKWRNCRSILNELPLEIRRWQ
jgi:predicted metal-dependent hydrolase